MTKDEEYMRIAIKEAEKASSLDEVPVGCVIVQDGKIIAKGHNLKEKNQDATKHAEMVAIQKASTILNTWCLDDCDLYVTLEPCLMCTGAIVQSRIRHVYYGASDPKGGCIDSVLELKSIPKINHHPKTTGGVLQPACSQILTSFFQKKRDEKKHSKAFIIKKK